MFDRDLTERMHCIKPIKRRGVDRAIGKRLIKGMHCIVPRIGKSRAFDRGSDYKYALYYTQLELRSLGCLTGFLLIVCTIVNPSKLEESIW